MTKEEKLNLIREKCIEANPEIAEIKPGCEVIVGDKNPQPLLHTIYEASREGIYSAYLNRLFPGYLAANDFYDCEFSGETEGVEILGRPIRLDDMKFILTSDDFHTICELWQTGYLSNQSEEIINKIHAAI